jgi:hypothetical protein
LELCSFVHYYGGLHFFFATIEKKKNKHEKWQEIKDIFTKLPLILVSAAITSIYIFLYFFFFGFITVSSSNGIGGSVSDNTLIYIFVLFGVTLFAIVMYQVFKTEKQDITLTLYNQFSVLKWSSLIILPFGIWSAYYFYHKDGINAWIALIIWSCIFYGIYKLMDKITRKVQDQITNANINRIFHEKKKNLINSKVHFPPPQNDTVINTNNSDFLKITKELKAFKELLDNGIISQEEFDSRKNKLLNN